MAKAKATTIRFVCTDDAKTCDICGTVYYGPKCPHCNALTSFKRR